VSALLRKLMNQHRLMDEAKGGEEGGAQGGDAGAAGDDKTPAADAKKDDKVDDKKTDDGKAKPTDAEAKLLKEVMKKKADLDKKDQELADAKAKLAEFDGIDLAAVRAMLADKKTAEENQLVAKGEFDVLKKRMADEHAKDLSKKDAAITEKDAKIAALTKTIGEMGLGSKFASSQFIAEEMNMTPSKARVIFGANFETKEDGTIVGYDKPVGAAGRAPLVNAAGEPLDFDAVMKTLVEADPDKDFLLKAKVKTGAGSNTTGSARRAVNSIGRESVAQGPLEKIAAGLKAGLLK
jgi:hypothetical protein